MKLSKILILFIAFLLPLTFLILGSIGIYVRAITRNNELERSVPTHHERKPCEKKKYILLSTQRSGSTWTCSQISLQDGISCGGNVNKGPAEKGLGIKNTELMMKYNNQLKSHNVSWDVYEESLDKAFEISCAYASSDSVVGFKLMYNQIPDVFVSSEPGPFGRYLQTHNVSVVHLVREAKILQLASLYSKRTQNNDAVKKLWHTKDKNLVEIFRNESKMPWTEGTIAKVQNFEREGMRWDTFVRSLTSVPYHYLSYEDMVIDKEAQLANVIAFLFLPAKTNLPSVRSSTTLLQMHETGCAARVANYTGFTKDERVSESSTVRACDKLERYLDKLQANDTR